MDKDFEKFLKIECPAFIEKFYKQPVSDEYWAKVGNAVLNWGTKYQGKPINQYISKIIVAIYEYVEDGGKE